MKSPILARTYEKMGGLSQPSGVEPTSLARFKKRASNIRGNYTKYRMSILAREMYCCMYEYRKSLKFISCSCGQEDRRTLDGLLQIEFEGSTTKLATGYCSLVVRS